jgi:hypothetical protein
MTTPPPFKADLQEVSLSQMTIAEGADALRPPKRWKVYRGYIVV